MILKKKTCIIQPLETTDLFFSNVHGKFTKTDKLPGLKQVWLDLLGMLSQNTTDWEPYKQQKLLNHSSGGCKSKIRVPAWSDKGLLLGCRLLIVSSHDKRASKFYGTSFIRVLISFIRAPLSWPKYLQKALPPNIITSGIMLSTYAWGEGSREHEHSDQSQV